MNQQKLWDNIAKEWNEFKKTPSKTVLEFLKKQSGNILDLGSGSGRHLTKIKNGKMFLVDFSEKMIKKAKNNAKNKKIPAECKVSELNKIPYPDNFFDSAICFDSLHCVETDKQREQTIKELYRVLKPRAPALISVWKKDSKRFKNAKKEKYIGWRDKGKRYYYLYNDKEIHDLFKKAGFKIKKKIPHNIKIEFIIESV